MLILLIAASAYNAWQAQQLRHEVAALKAEIVQKQRIVSKPEPVSTEEPMVSPGGIGSDLEAKKREFLHTKQDLERGIAQTQQAAKKAEDETAKSVAAMQRRLSDLQRKADVLWSDSKKGIPSGDSER